MKDSVSLKISGLKCDAPGCGWRDLSVQVTEYAACIDRPCPDCGANLLTKEDYAAAYALIAAAAMVNLEQGPVPDDSVRYSVRVEFDGHGGLTFEHLGEEEPNA